MYGYIYKITNIINGKSYIGKTLKSKPEQRWTEHIRDSRKQKLKNRPLYSAMNKYGVDNFTFQIICKVNEEDLNNAEIEAIQEFNTYGNNGYNATLGGDGTKYIEYSNDEILYVYKKYKSLNKASEILGICGDTISNIVTKYGINPVDVANTSMQNTNKYIAVLKDGESIEFENVREVSQYVIDMGLSKGTLTSVITNIPRAARGIRESAFGFEWIEVAS